MRETRTLFLSLLLGLTGGLAGCASDTTIDPGGDDQPLSDIDAILEGAPADRGMSIPFDAKADETIPATFDVMDTATPVRSQGSRGTCTIFATAALMESLYVREGTLAMPDFSEQFLQWSVKTEVGAFTDGDGSNPQYNLQAINRYGIVLESLWPYESSPWTSANDPACNGMDGNPVRCYTNGDPPEAARMAQRFTLPAGRWINPSARSLKGHILSTRTPIVVSGPFFYQSWNHGRSRLTTSSEHQANGYVLSPNEEDVMDSSGDRRAGHGITLYGWDDNLAVQRRDAMGNPMVDAMGAPVMERGFFLFKNSWGTGRFGRNNPHGAGFGWISYDYVQRYMTAYVSGLPQVRLREVCNDGADNDRDMQTDCADSDCAAERACMDPGNSNESTTPVAIPDNNTTGASSTITIAEAGTISSLAVSLDIEHTYVGDLRVELTHGGTTTTLIDRQGGSADNMQRTFDVADFNGADAAGDWVLRVVDTAAQDTGTLRSWRVDITRCTTDCSGSAQTRTYSDTAGVSIPDDDTTGLARTIEVSDTGTIQELSVTVDITHPFPLDLTVRLAKEGGREFVVFTEDSMSTGGVQRTFRMTQFDGEQLAGRWRLTVVDGAARDVGTLNGWSLQVTAR
ncbi:MAG: proprotein convertase P-domain-containing protein [Sandaracinaceae bacterium]|nr:proprotein convertase P-domain-containing protein [Sandaracinaceae bacterium]